MSEAIDRELDRLLDLHEIRNLMGRYEYMHTDGLHEGTAELFARNAPGVKLEISNFGVYDGFDSARRFMVGANALAEAGGRQGHLHLHTLTTPVIEVATDGQTAQGVWISPGVETGPRPDGTMMAMVQWIKYGVDFVKEDGRWRFWHFHMYRIFMAGYDQSWADVPPRPPVRLPPEIGPDRENTYEWIYTPRSVSELVPEPPLPFETWDEERAYVK